MDTSHLSAQPKSTWQTKCVMIIGHVMPNETMTSLERLKHGSAWGGGEDAWFKLCRCTDARSLSAKVTAAREKRWEVNSIIIFSTYCSISAKYSVVSPHPKDIWYLGIWTSFKDCNYAPSDCSPPPLTISSRETPLAISLVPRPTPDL